MCELHAQPPSFQGLLASGAGAANGGVAYTYDARGNLTAVGARTFTYDLENRLTAGAAVAYAYGPYGEPANDNWSGARFRYTGQIALPEARLYHYKARVYDPKLGRFLQTDPKKQMMLPRIMARVTRTEQKGAEVAAA